MALRIGLAGLGVHGLRYAKHLLNGDVPGATLTAVCRRNEAAGREFARENGLLWVGDPHDLAACPEVGLADQPRAGRRPRRREHGQIWGDHIHRTLTTVEGTEATDLGPVPPCQTIPAALESFVRCCRDGTEPEVTAADGVATLELVEAANLSASLGRRVRLDELPR